MGQSLRIVTGADWSHARTLVQLLESIKQYEPKVETVVYDLGMTTDQLAYVSKALGRGRMERFQYENYLRLF